MNLPCSIIEVEKILTERGWIIPKSNRFQGIYSFRFYCMKGLIKRVTLIDAWNEEFKLTNN